MLVSLEGTFGDETQQITIEQSYVPRTSAHQDTPGRCLAETLDARSDAKNDDRSITDDDSVDGVLAWIAGVRHCLMQRFLDFLRQLTSDDRRVVTHADKQNSAACIRKCDYGFLDGTTAYPFLEFDVLALSRKFRREVRLG